MFNGSPEKDKKSYITLLGWLKNLGQLPCFMNKSYRSLAGTFYCNSRIVPCKEFVKNRDWHLFLHKIKALSYLTEILAQIK